MDSIIEVNPNHSHNIMHLQINEQENGVKIANDSTCYK